MLTTHRLGREGPEMGRGCVAMTQVNGNVDEQSLVATIEFGCIFLGAAAVYDLCTNEELLSRLPHGCRDQVTIATKFDWDIKRHAAGGLKSRLEHRHQKAFCARGADLARTRDRGAMTRAQPPVGRRSPSPRLRAMCGSRMPKWR